MKKVLASVLVVVAVLFGTMTQAWAKITGSQQHGDWTVGIGGLELPYISTLDVDRQSELRLQFLPDLKLPIISIDIPNASEFPGINKLDGKIVPSKVLVGNGKVLNVQFAYIVIDGSINTLALYIQPEFNTTMIHEIIQADPSSSIRIKVYGIQKIWEYPLNGFNEALDRGMDLKKVLK